MIHIDDKKKCCGCHACYNSCPQKCISMQSDDEGFWYPAVDHEKCTDCGQCEKVCPILREHIVENYPAAYACINKDDRIRQQSSSGGVFTAIAERVIANHGVVFGAGFDKDFNVLHSWTESLDGLANFRGSKYVQSCIGNTYKQTKDFLRQGRQVLFSGTPCQIAGLMSYLGKNDPALLCVDMICHGVPSPLVWQQYRRQLTNNKELKSINFRDKTFGWKRFSMRFAYKNGDDYVKELSSDEFMQGFLKNLYLRPSCYHCNFKTLNRHSDITLADFWGIGNVVPSLDDDQGTSLILVNSQTGKEIFLDIQEKIAAKKVDLGQALLYNSCAIKSVDYNAKRDSFFPELSGTQDLNQLIHKYTKVSFSINMYLRLRRLLGRMKRWNR